MIIVKYLGTVKIYYSSSTLLPALQVFGVFDNALSYRNLYLSMLSLFLAADSDCRTALLDGLYVAINTDLGLCARNVFKTSSGV